MKVAMLFDHEYPVLQLSLFHFSQSQLPIPINRRNQEKNSVDLPDDWMAHQAILCVVS